MQEIELDKAIFSKNTDNCNVQSKWFTIWGDGKITYKETWDDGNVNDNDGWSSVWQLQTYESRFNWTNSSSRNPSTVWIDNWGDGFNTNKNIDSVSYAGKEKYWDDKNKVGGDGVNSIA